MICDTCNGTGQSLRRFYYKKLQGRMTEHLTKCISCNGTGEIEEIVLPPAIPGITECPKLGRTHVAEDIVDDERVRVCQWCGGICPNDSLGTSGNNPTSDGGRVMPPIHIGSVRGSSKTL